MELNYPKYPCVALLGKTRQTTYKAPGEKVEVDGDEYMYYPINSVNDLDHVDQMRKFKRYSVVGFANLDEITKRAPYKAIEVAQIKQRLDGMANPPELQRKLEAKDAELAALKAKIAAQVEAQAVEATPVVEAKSAKKSGKEVSL